VSLVSLRINAKSSDFDASGPPRRIHDARQSESARPVSKCASAEEGPNRPDASCVRTVHQ